MLKFNLRALTFLLLLPGSCFPGAARCGAQEPPNIVYIMSDELAYYELAHMGNDKLHTPHIDRMAREGIRFTQALAAAPVCAPLRCALMTGKHMGHASVRANDGGTPLRADEPTIASSLKQLGYATGGFGKWGAGGRGSTGVPEDHGFDIFFGYYDQVHAHSFYPPYLVKNSQEVRLPGNRGGRSGETYSHYEIVREALEFIREHKDQPFFCYLPITPPHGMYDIPASDPAWEQYANDAWMQDPEIPQDAKNYAAMVTMVDHNVGQVLALLDELKLDDNTLVFFTGDNGGQDRFKSPQWPRGYFGPNVNPTNGEEFRGQKGNLYEGGLRIPFLARWPGKIEAGRVSDLLFYQVDMYPTLLELTKATGPADLDGLSILPELLGPDAVGRPQAKHEFLYWEFGNQVAVRVDNWKGIRPNANSDWELYDLSQDISELVNVASQHPQMVARMKAYAAQSHQPVRAGTYQDRQLHEQDRRAKWGTAAEQPKPRKESSYRLKHPQLIPAAELSLVRASSENKGNGRLASHAIDGQPQTVWHTQFSPALVKGPHELVIDLGSSRALTGIQYLARQDSGWNGTFGKVAVCVSQTADDFGQPLVEHTFTKQRQPQTAEFPQTVNGRFIRLQILSSADNGPWASAADIGVLAAKD